MSELRYIRSVVDPLLMKLRQELYGSGISYGTTIVERLVPVSITRNDDVPGIVEDAGFIKGITVYSGNTLIATEQKEISFSGAYVYSVGDRAYVRITPGGGGSGSPLTVKEQDGSPTVANVTVIQFSGAVVTDNGGGDVLVEITPGFTNPLTAAGDIMYHDGVVASQRLPIGVSGQVLTVIASGVLGYDDPTLSYVTFRESDGNPSFNATEIIVPPNSLQMSGLSAAKLGFPRTVGWYIDGGFVTTTDIGPNIFVDVPCTITGIRLYAKTAPSGGTLDVDVRLSSDNGASYTTIFSTRPTITAGNRVGGTNAVFSTTTVTTGQILRFDIVTPANARSLTASLFMVTY